MSRAFQQNVIRINALDVRKHGITVAEDNPEILFDLSFCSRSIENHRLQKVGIQSERVDEQVGLPRKFFSFRRQQSTGKRVAVRPVECSLFSAFNLCDPFCWCNGGRGRCG